MKLLVFGGRNYVERGIVFDALDHLHARFGIEKLVHGGASGADQHAEVWAVTRGKMPVYRELAHWTDLSHPDAIIRMNQWGYRYDARAGTRRNGAMLAKYPPTHALEFPGGNGTRDMRRRCNLAGIPVFQVYTGAHDSHVEIFNVREKISSLAESGTEASNPETR